ncbi:MAG: Ig-like domain-containing protein, partial [Ignavibacteriales bacterium]|nr:Ig-like domain-containing protein [Ignavibacteriales bacterium]
MKPRRNFQVFLLVGFLFSSLEAQVRLRVPDTTVVRGTTLLIPVYVDSSVTEKNVTAYQLEMRFEPYYFAIDTVVSAGTMTTGPWTYSFNIGSNGLLSIAAASDTTPLQGTGVLIYVRTHLLHPGGVQVSFTDTLHNFLNQGSPRVILDNGIVSINEPPSITVYPDQALLAVGEQQQFSAYGGTAPYLWSVTNSSVASIDSNGFLQALQQGFTRVVAGDTNGILDTTNNLIEIRSIKLSLRDTTVFAGRSEWLPLYVSSVNGLNISSGSFTLQFDANAFVLDSVRVAGTLLASSSVSFNSLARGKFQCAFASDSSLSGSGVLLYLRVSIPSSSTYGSYVQWTEATFNQDVFPKTVNASVNVAGLQNLYVNPSTSDLIVGDSLEFMVSGGIAPYRWTTTDTSLAKIDSTGLLLAQRSGVVRVTVRDSVGSTGVTGDIHLYDAKVSLGNVNAKRGGILELPITIDRYTQGYSVTAFQLTLDFDSSLIKATGIQSSTTLTDGWTGSFSVAGNRITVASANDSGFQSTGTLVKVIFDISSSVSYGAYIAVQFRQMLFNEGKPLPLTQDGFIYIIPPPSIPNLLSPVNNAVNQLTDILFQWYAASNVETYRFRVSEDSSFAVTTIDDSTLLVTSRQVNGLARGTSYYWSVNATNAGGTSPSSTVWRFTTIVAPPSAPVLASPADNAAGVPTTVTLRWMSSSGASSYRVQVSASSDFSTTVLDNSGITDTSAVVSGLASNTTYFWRVSAANAGGTSGFSAVWTFTTLSVPQAPILFAPADSATGVTLPLTLRWNQSSAATSYRLQVATNSSFSPTAIDSSQLVDTSFVLTNLTANTTYYWRVNAANSAGMSPYSSVRRFTTLAPPSPPLLYAPAD